MTSLKNPITFTANRLLDGEVVWLGANGNWVESIAAAHAIFTEAEKDAFAKIAAKADADNIVVEPYEIDLVVEDGRVSPVRFREQIRAAGPTIRMDLGKQAEKSARAA